MKPTSFSDTALVLLGHGTALNAESAAPVFQHAAEIRRRAVFAEVREAFWKQEPGIARVLEEVRAPRIILVPLFMSEGYFSEHVMPRALGFSPGAPEPGARVLRRPGRLTVYARPVGTHQSMCSVVLDRAREVVRRFPFPTPPREKEITLFLAAHGTSQHENSRAAVENLAAFVRSMNLYAAVHSVFLEEEPPISACLGLAATRNLVVVPFFASDGLHVTEDIPVLLGEPKSVIQRRLDQKQPPWRNPTEKHGKLIWYTSSVGTDPVLADVILTRATEAAHWASVGEPDRSKL